MERIKNIIIDREEDIVKELPPVIGAVGAALIMGIFTGVKKGIKEAKNEKASGFKEKKSKKKETKKKDDEIKTFPMKDGSIDLGNL